MNSSTYRDMHLLNEVTRSPDVTQRELSKRIGVALGLTNLMLRRLAKKGYIKISGTKRSRIRYLITPQGILEKSRLTYEFVQYSLQLYRRMRVFLREQLTAVAKAGHRRILLCGTSELAEIAFLTIHEMGLEFIGVVDDVPDCDHFLGHRVRRISDVGIETYDRIIVTSLRWGDGGIKRLAELGIPLERIITLPQSGFPHPASRGMSSADLSTVASTPMTTATPRAEFQEAV